MKDDEVRIKSELQAAHDRLDEMMPTSYDKNKMILTLLGQSAPLLNFLAILMNKSPSFPEGLKASVMVLITNWLAFSSFESKSKPNPVFLDDAMTESNIEDYHRAFKNIVKIIHQGILEQEKQEEELNRLAESEVNDGDVRCEGADSPG